MAEKITLAHGSGGKASHELIERLFVASFGSKALVAMEDSAVLEAGNATIAFSTDSFVVDPIFFPGGDIGKLAVAGTVNDLAVSGAKPLFLSSAFIIEKVDIKENKITVVHFKNAAL